MTAFLERLEREKPRPAVVLAREISRLAPAGLRNFEILSSDGEEARTAAVLPDLATCRACLSELFDPKDRRYRYPFINCTLCGPRYTIVREIPYDRPNTTMRDFPLCPDCAREYNEPADRRFHAQPVACPACGPQVGVSIEEAARALEAGLIVALKGIGGFQLLVDALNEEAVVRLRQRKQREEKPFALLMRDLETVRRYCLVSPEEEAAFHATLRRHGVCFHHFATLSAAVAAGLEIARPEGVLVLLGAQGMDNGTRIVFELLNPGKHPAAAEIAFPGRVASPTA